VDKGAVEVDWIAGMFMLFRSDTYRALGGFDETYFLYYEDVDLCHRLRKTGKSVIYNPAAEIVHDARRASRKDPRLAYRHLCSALRYFSRF
jgi:GT2 family glycosyltransferase